ncbi:DUF2752 domain-containing protein [Hymenobacter rubidus]|uniref:DUF2752 domain-containing protein n=1 Tax=Hymenobacter rubidus TaxID=1441626 RepID=UPI00191EE482|nr:DUF2752 domain-containing protein [Hymenobacter rubidus]
MATTLRNSNPTQPHRWRAQAVVVGSALVWLTLLLLPADFLDHTKSICLSRVLLDQECPGCGMGRACMHAIHLQWRTAWGFNHLFVLVLPMLAFLWAKEVLTSARRLGWIGF